MGSVQWSVNCEQCDGFSDALNFQMIESFWRCPDYQWFLLATNHWPLTTGFLLISTIGIKVHIEGISRQADCHRIIRRDIESRHARRIDALHGYLFWGDRQILIFGFANHIVADVLLRFLEVRTIDQSYVAKIVLKTVVRH